MDFLKFLIRKNIFIACSAVMLVLGTEAFVYDKITSSTYLAFVFFATNFDYTLHDFVKATSKKNRNLLIYLTISFIGIIVSLVFMKTNIFMYLLPLGFLTLLYSLPYISTKSTIFNIHKIPGLKTLLVAFVWSIITCYIPLLQGEIVITTKQLFLFTIERFLFIYAITLPFNIRDMEEDKKLGFKTIPILIGGKKSNQLSSFGIILFLLVATFHYLHLNEPFALLVHFVTALFALYIINSKRLQSSKIYYSFYIDGSLLIYGILMMSTLLA